MESISTKLDRWLIRRLLRAIGDPLVAVEVDGGASVTPNGETAKGRVVVRNRRAIWRIALNPEFRFPEAYAAGEIEVDDLELLLSTFFADYQNQGSPGLRRRVAERWVLPSRGSLARSRQQIRHHYDIGNDFYRLWLDEQMVYTCAYFAEPSLTLEQAQAAKMEHVCRKLCLRPGMRVVDAGCGWGALALHMARHHGVTVDAFNISGEQIEYARERARLDGLEGRVRFVHDDWRNIRGRYDAFASVGMLEHLGRSRYRELGDVIHAALKPQGIGLIHSIGRSFKCRLNRWIERRIFPGAYPPPLREMMEIFEPHRFSVLDVENLRLHYAETLRCWLTRYEKSVDQIAEEFDDRFARAWRLYLLSSMLSFRYGSLQLFQVVFAHGSNNELPRTRGHVYPQPTGTGHEITSV